ncbi:MAG TPA: exodeoxyribonuclease VII small subunit [Gammaproteobacteria bacterium]|nr:exodeoxyribonuclease VII small subunit [Gammaproteobacteria bacterium]
MPKKSPPTFEAAKAELEKIVSAMENDKLSLEESLKQFERGVELTRFCQKELAAAEQKINTLVEKNGEPELTPFDDTGGQ